VDRDEQRRCAALGPFELRHRLLELAARRDPRAVLDAGRGTPDWIALAPRAAFFLLGEFAIGDAARAPLGPDLGGVPPRPGIAQRLSDFLAARPASLARTLIEQGVALARDAHRIEPDALVSEWVDGVLGDRYPTPVRMLAHAEVLVRAHLAATLLGGDTDAGRLDLFAVEGASAGITYVFQSLVHAGLLAPGDRIAIGTPVFAPYLEVPRLPEYRFETLMLRQDATRGWRYPAAEIERLADPRVRAFVAVNPSNPTSTAIDPETLEQVGRIVRARPELIVITDDVYAPFVRGFRSLATAAPRNTVLLYSFSKFWGATGLRLGVVALHADNALDARLRDADGVAPQAATRRYGALSMQPSALKLIDRMAADSRAVGLNHTAGLSTPQQVQMTLFALDALLDVEGRRAGATAALLARRWRALFEGLGQAPPDHPGLTRYYATIDVPAIARARHGAAFADWLRGHHEPVDVVVRLAAEHGIVVLDGRGFDAPAMSVRVSLANLPDEAYRAIGRAISRLVDAYHRRWTAR
jgi:aspartate 4-decarboxylase